MQYRAEKHHDPFWSSGVIYVLQLPGGAMTYERMPGHPTAVVNYHWRHEIGASQQGNDGEPCEFLNDEQACWFDGSGLVTPANSEDDIWKILWARAPERPDDPNPEFIVEEV